MDEIINTQVKFKRFLPECVMFDNKGKTERGRNRWGKMLYWMSYLMLLLLLLLFMLKTLTVERDVPWP